MRGRRGDDLGGDLPGRAGLFDLAVGVGKAFRPWFVGLLVLGAVVALLAYGANRPADPTFVDADGSTSTTLSGLAFEQRRIAVGDRCLTVEVADTPEKRAQGLKNRDSLGEINGMLFLFEQPVNATFTSADVRVPLTVGFYDDAGMRVDALDMEACPAESSTECPTYTPASPFRNALQVARGQLPEGPLALECPS